MNIEILFEISEIVIHVLETIRNFIFLLQYNYNLCWESIPLTYTLGQPEHTNILNYSDKMMYTCRCSQVSSRVLSY